ncbi:energy transducer TonB [Flammeovirga sp. SJP92]|uniref:energy transducer TonB n=1 Tax=Flammeovirga sp. SJP92 TaxID=1775430 RepID=UPI00078753A7|nr:hypothetical protein [Flammeovirga sp. SJP92]KXX71057.1 hypothetical protein AVL50_10670 [Flammeovirga sp. SJP92]
MKHIVLLLYLFPCLIYGQSSSIDTLFYGFDEIVSTIDSAFTVRYINYDSISKRYEYEEWLTTEMSHGGLVQRGTLKSISPEIKDGKFWEVDDFGNSVTYVYSNNSFIDIIEYLDKEGQAVEPIYNNGIIEKSATYTGGMNKLFEFLSEELSIEQLQQKNRIYVRFVIEKNGKTSNITPITGETKELNPKVYNALSKLTFIPAMHKGKNVRTSLIIPIQIKMR